MNNNTSDSMSCREAEEFLYSLVSYERFGLKKYGQQTFSMAVFRHLMQLLGHPERRLRAIHVAGTDGKGSTCQYLSSILNQAGYSVGTYTSPHLDHVRQRIQINCQPVDEDTFAKTFEHLKPVLESVADALPEDAPEWEKKRPSFFEAITAAAFVIFAEKNLDFSVVEVGLGGRLDATNILDPYAAILTPLDLEHTEFLGTTIESIATEKAGIAKKNRPFIIGPQRKDISNLLHEKCLEIGAIPCHAESLANIEIISRSLHGYGFHFGEQWKEEQGKTYFLNEWENNGKSEFLTPLLGDHQVQNAVLAISCLKFLEQRQQLKTLSDEIIQRGLSKTQWPARTEVFRLRDTDSVVVIDAAHTVQAARTLRKTLDQLFPEGKFCFIVGYLEGKRIAESVAELIEEKDTVLCVQPYSPRAIPVDTLFEQLRNINCSKIKKFDNISKAFDEAVSSKKMVVVAGSIYLAGEIRKYALQNERISPFK